MLEFQELKMPLAVVVVRFADRTEDYILSCLLIMGCLSCRGHGSP
jgi:hypothetical protein